MSERSSVKCLGLIAGDSFPPHPLPYLLAPSFAPSLFARLFDLRAAWKRKGIGCYADYLFHYYADTPLHGLFLYQILAQKLDVIQLLRQRLSHKSEKAYVTMPIGIMGSKNFVCLIEVQGDSATRNEKEGIRFLCCFFPAR